MKSTKIGFVGVGRMGANMARRLKEVGYPVVAVSDSNREIANELGKELGCEAPSKLSKVSELADAVFTVVTDDTAMRQIYFGEDNLFAHAAGRLFINCATISPAVHVEIATKGAELGASVIEAPMASSVTHAREGKLFLMLAGDRSVIDKAEPLLKDLAVKMQYIGGPGKAAQLKALVNMVMNINTAGLAEGLGLADAIGLDLNVVREVFAQTGANSRVLETDGADMQNREHDVYFSAAHAAKDSGIALALAQGAGLELPLAKATFEQYERMKALGLGELDKSGISELTFTSRRTRNGA